jgi:hypothetical protein
MLTETYNIGDNGIWTSWDNYLTRVISDIKANSMTAGLRIDIWNEPDLTYFWTKGQTQYLQMWGRTYHRLRSVCQSMDQCFNILSSDKIYVQNRVAQCPIDRSRVCWPA